MDIISISPNIFESAIDDSSGLIVLGNSSSSNIDSGNIGVSKDQNKKNFKHIAPRIDPTLYQAEISDAASKDFVEISNLSLFEESRLVSSSSPEKKSAIEEFICVYRNMLSNIRLQGSDFWLRNFCDFPLDSDETVLQYLAEHGFDVDEAVNHLFCQLSYGKDQLFTEIVANPVTKCSNVFALTEMSSRLSKHKGSMIGYMSSSKSQDHSDNSSSSHNGNVKSTNSFLYLKSDISISKPISEEVNISLSSEQLAENQEVTEIPSTNLRISRTGERDKQEIRLKWHYYFDKISNGLKHPFQMLASEAQELAESVALLPSYPNAIGEDFSDILKTSLGELIKETMESRRWSSLIRDTCFHLSSNIDSLSDHPIQILRKLIDQAKQLVLIPHDYDYWCSALIEGENLVNKMTSFIRSNYSESAKLSPSSLNEWIILSNSLPFLLPETKEIKRFYEEADQLTMSVRSLLLSKEICIMRKPKLRESIRVSFDNALALKIAVQQCPLKIYRCDELNALIDEVNSWKNEVKEIAESNKSIPLRKIEQLITTGESFPFLVLEELDILRDKKNNAKLWLDKLKKTFQSSNVSRRNNLANTTTDSNGNVILDSNKLDLDEMKMLVMEGQGLFDDGISDDTNNKVRNKELSKAKTIVDLADNWLEKVRDILSSGNSFGSDLEGKDEEDILSELRSSLEEANQLPVVMDEILVLNCHVQALEWSIKAKRLLPKEIPVGFNNYGTVTFMKQTELFKLNKEIQRIRSSLSQSLAESYPLRILPEELQCKKLVEQVTQWNDEMKKVVQNNCVKKGVSIEILKRLFEQCYQIPLNLETEAKPLKVAIVAACDWTKKHMNVLNKLGITSMDRIFSESSCIQIVKSLDCEDSLSVWSLLKDKKVKAVIKSNSNDNLEIPNQDNNLKSKDSIEIEIKSEEWHYVGEILSQDLLIDEINDGNISNQLVSYAELQHLVSTSTLLNAEFDEASLARGYLEDLEQWLQNVRYALEGSSEPFAAITLTNTNTRGRKSRIKGSSKDNLELPTRSIKSLQQLLQQSSKLKVSIESEKKKIEDMLSSSLEWDRETSKFIIDFDKIMSGYIHAYNDIFINIFKKLVLPNISLNYYHHIHGMFTSLESKSIPENFLKGVNIDIDLKAEENLFDLFIQSFDKLQDLIIESDRKNIVTTSSTLSLQGMLLCKEWIIAARSVLTGEWLKSNRGIELWGDFDLSLVDDLLNCGVLIIGSVDTIWLSSNIEKETSLEVLLEIFLLGKSLTDDAETYYETLQENYSNKYPVTVTRRKAVSETVSAIDETLEEDFKPTAVTVTTTTTSSKQRNIKRNKLYEDYDRDFKIVKRKKVNDNNDVGNTSNSPSDDINEDNKKNENNDDKKEDKRDEKKEDKKGKESTEKEKPIREFKCHDAVIAILKSIKQFNRTVSTYAKEDNQNLHELDKAIIPTYLSKLIHLWHWQLQLLRRRLCECSTLVGYSDFLLKRSAYSGRKPAAEDIAEIIDIAELRHLICQDMMDVKQSYTKAQTWSERANRMIERDHSEKLLSLDNLKSFITEGENMFFDMKELLLLRTEYRKAKAWYTKLQKSGIDKFDANEKDLQELIDESKLISVDLSDGIQQIMDSKLKYCICRQESHSDMIGCDSCKEWYHYSCIGLTKLQVDKLDKYTCIRCLILSSFDSSAVAAGTIVNRWMNPEELIQSIESKRNKIQKRIQKETKELQKLEHQVKIQYALITSNSNNNNNITTSSVSINNNGELPNNLSNNNFNTSITNNNEIDINTEESQNLQKLLQDISDIKKKINSSKQDEVYFSRRRELESSKRDECQEWMHVLQRIIWPQSQEEISAGRPLGPNNPVGFDLSIGYQKSDLIVLRSLVPDAIRRAAEAAIALGIESFEDVLNLLEYFRHMSWCNIVINAIRGPLTTITLRRLLESANELKYVDEKVVKFFQGILMKASQWKTKARKFYSSVRGTDHLLDIKKLMDIVLEGNGIPINSRLKTMLRKALDRLQKRESTSTSRGRSTSMLSSSNSIHMIIPNVDLPNSSDDENNQESGSYTNKNETLDENDEWFLYEDIKGLSLAPEPPDKWPLKMPFPAYPRSLHKNTIANTSSMDNQQNLLSTSLNNNNLVKVSMKTKQINVNKPSIIQSNSHINNKSILPHNQIVTVQKKGIHNLSTNQPIRPSSSIYPIKTYTNNNNVVTHASNQITSSLPYPNYLSDSSYGLGTSSNIGYSNKRNSNDVIVSNVEIDSKRLKYDIPTSTTNTNSNSSNNNNNSNSNDSNNNTITNNNNSSSSSNNNANNNSSSNI